MGSNGQPSTETTDQQCGDCFEEKILNEGICKQEFLVSVEPSVQYNRTCLYASIDDRPTDAIWAPYLRQ